MAATASASTPMVPPTFACCWITARKALNCSIRWGPTFCSRNLNMSRSYNWAWPVHLVKSPMAAINTRHKGKSEKAA